MSTPDQLFRDGDLTGAVAALTAEVKSAAADAGRRTFLFELLAFAGELDRAGRQLDVIGQLDGKAEPTVQVYRNLLDAERTRQKVLAGGARPEFLIDPPGWMADQLQAIEHLKAGRPADAAASLALGESRRQPLQGTRGETPFVSFRDCDDLLAPVLEFMLIRDYLWVPFEQLAEIEVLPPEYPRDLLWSPVRLTLRDGTDHRGFVPALYDGSSRHADDQVRLGRATDWIAASDAPVRGVGQRLFLVGESDCGLLELGKVAFSNL